MGEIIFISRINLDSVVVTKALWLGCVKVASESVHVNHLHRRGSQTTSHCHSGF